MDLGGDWLVPELTLGGEGSVWEGEPPYRASELNSTAIEVGEEAKSARGGGTSSGRDDGFLLLIEER